MNFPEKWCYNIHHACVDLWQWMVIKKNGEVIQSQYMYFNTEIANQYIDYDIEQNSQIEYQPKEMIGLDTPTLLINCFAYLYWVKVMTFARENCTGKIIL